MSMGTRVCACGVCEVVSVCVWVYVCIYECMHMLSAYVLVHVLTLPRRRALTKQTKKYEADANLAGTYQCRRPSAAPTACCLKISSVSHSLPK